MKFTEVFGKKLMIFDGAFGTSFQRMGLEVNEIPEMWNFTHAENVYAVTKSYIDAGSDVVSANTFGANRYKLDTCGLSVEETVKNAVDITKKAISDSGKDVYIALSVGSLGKLIAPLGELEFEEAVDAFAEIVRAGEKSGVDFVLFETFSDPYEMKAAVIAAKENTSLPIVVTMIPGDNDRLLFGGTPADTVVMLEGLGVNGIGLNCGNGPEQFLRILPDFMKAAHLPVLCSANAGIPHSENGRTYFDVDIGFFTECALKMVSMGVSAVGGCCGTDDRYISAVKTALNGKDIVKNENKKTTVISSRSKSVTFGDSPLIIGERINPTGKSRFKQAIRENDMSYILDEAKAQEADGAHILDVNVGLPGIDEKAFLVDAVKAVQSVTDLPIQIDTSDKSALEEAMRIYNGKPLINSVNGSEESMNTVFPLMKKYGGVAVCLAMDENGIPETPEGRVKVIERIIENAEKYGIDKCDLIADGLVTSEAASKGASEITLDTIEKIKNNLCLHTVLGISNISFGLPDRESINASFFSLALSRGLSAGIVNPHSKPIMDVYSGKVKANYSDYAKMTEIKTCTENSDSLKGAVISGLASKAASFTKELLKETSQIEIINAHLIPALDEVGKGFESGKIFLPQLLMAAEAAKASFDVIKSSYENGAGSKKPSGEKIVIATVFGDIHDIGKNIVKTLLENYGYNVIDLGKNVPAEDIVKTVIEENVRLAGLSALMTTTVVNMEKTIRLLHEKAPECKIMVGGAVLNKEYADSIGADFYAKDAVSSVNYAKEVFGETNK